jgi:hypothetical protein
MTEDRRQKSEIRGQKTEVRDQRSEVGCRGSDVRGQLFLWPQTSGLIEKETVYEEVWAQ